MENSNSKSAIVDAIKQSANILVTVSRNPSVDALAAALGFSLMLNKLDKHATAVFSGVMPPAIQFLEPEKNFEGSVSSLRDFIIALDKEKADRLRYKVEGDVVRIYITPYKTAITQKDLEFSEGDFNVDLVIALGVEKQSDLDSAISAHGRILHDATVATINLENTKSSLGTIDWNDDKASSLCEMLMGLSEALQSNLLDEQIATALLTGIVAATDRFSNAHTSPRVMTMSAQLMAAGANQQLISEKLEAGGESLAVPPGPKDGSTMLEEGRSSAVNADVELPPVQQPAVDGEMQVRHDGDDIQQTTAQAQQLASEATDDRRNQANAKLEQALGHVSPLEDLKNDVAAAEHEQQEKQGHSTDWRDHVQDPYPDEEPIMGGTLNATTSEAEAAKRAEERSARNHTLLSHDAPPSANPFIASSGAGAQEPDDVDPFAEPDRQQDASQEPVLHHEEPVTHGKTIQPVTMPSINTPPPQPHPQSVPPPSFAPFPAAPTSDVSLAYEETPIPLEAPHNQTLADLEAEVHAAAGASPATSSIDDARNAVNSAFGSQPLSVGGQPAPVYEPHASGTSFAPPPPPPLPPNFADLPPLPPAPNGPHPAAPPQFPQSPSPAAPAPGQFQIPGQ